MKNIEMYFYACENCGRLFSIEEPEGKVACPQCLKKSYVEYQGRAIVDIKYR